MNNPNTAEHHEALDAPDNGTVSQLNTANLAPEQEADRLFHEKRNRKRLAAEKRFRLYGILGLSTALGALVILMWSIFSTGYGAFKQSIITLDVELSKTALDIEDASPESVKRADYGKVLKNSLQAEFPEVTKRKDKRRLYKLLSNSAELSVRDLLLEQPEQLGKTVSLTLPLSSDTDQYLKHQDDSSNNPRLNAKQQSWVKAMQEKGMINSRFNTDFFTQADSRSPEMAGIAGAFVGSIYTLLICLLITFPLGVSAAIYLEEFSRDTLTTRFIEANINNLAAVPSVVFGLFGLAIILNGFGLPRSTPLVGGIVLALMTLPTIIIASRAAIKAVPSTIRQAGLGMGASKVQVVFHHVIPVALPGILTGTIIGLAQALGETAPLLMIGMVAFISDIPSTPLDPSAVMPVQIYLWAESAERGFVEKTAAAIMCIIVFLVVMNLLAVLIRQRSQKKH